MRAVIGFDTSCYTTSVALVDEGGQVLGSFRKLLLVEEGKRGLRQSEGVFLHVKQIAPLVEEAFAAHPGIQIMGIGAANKPRNEADSYMPVFMVGDAHGRALASALGIPAFSFSHQQGHIRAALIDSGLEKECFLAMHLSGGTTELLEVKSDEITLIGGSCDLHAGQLIDRTGVALGLPFPAGPALEKLAIQGESAAKIPTAMAECGMRCHLSGAETQLRKWIEEGIKKEDIARECFDFLSRTMAKMVLAGAAKTGLKDVLIAGGVASSELFRKLIQFRINRENKSVKAFFGRVEYSGDNAVGIASLALDELRRGK